MTPSPLAIAALLFGLTSSLHCAAMCGPLVTAVLPPRASATLVCATARIAAYTGGGLAAGALGELVSFHLPRYLVPALGLTGALFLAAQAIGISFPGPSGEGWRRVTARALVVVGTTSPLARGALLGASTAVLPCGLLASVYALSASTGTAQRGALVAGAFALGSTLGLFALPLALRLLVPGRLAAVVQRASLLLAALALVARVYGQARSGSCCP